MKHSLFAVLFLLLAASPVRAELGPDTAAKNLGAIDTQTYKLYQHLVGSTWGYVWRHTTVDVSFGQGGNFTKSPWPGATWRITGPYSIAIKHPKSGEMAVHLNPELNKWTCKDWSGDKAQGIWHDPNKKVAP